MRYADDILFLAEIKEDSEKLVKESKNRKLKKYGLVLNRKKTKRSSRLVEFTDDRKETKVVDSFVFLRFRNRLKRAAC